MTEVQTDEQNSTSPTVNDDKLSEQKELQNGNVTDEDDDINNGTKDEADNSEEDSEEELGSLEKPVEILTTKRDRKSTERLSLEKYTEAKKPEEEIDYTKGKGIKLGEIEFVKYQLDKTLAEDLKVLHRVIFHRVAKVTLIKKNIRSFCGFPFEKDSKNYMKVSNTIERLTVANVKFVLGILGLEKGGDRNTLKERLLDFLSKPVDLGKSIPGRKGKKEKGSSNKKKSKKSSTKKSQPKKESQSSETVSDDDISSASDNESESEEKSAKIAKKKPKKQVEKKKKSPIKKTAAIKISMPKKKKDASPKKRKADDESDDDDAPLVKKVKTAPSDVELRGIVSAILKDANLEEVTMKTVVKQVYEKFPEFDLTSRKDFIKNTVKEIIS